MDPLDGVVKERIGQERSHREVIERGIAPHYFDELIFTKLPRNRFQNRIELVNQIYI